MNGALGRVLNTIGETHKGDIAENSRNYLEVSIGGQAQKLGIADVAGRYRNVNAVVPLKRPASGMKVRIDGRTFVNYARLPNGVVVPGYVALETGQPCTRWSAEESMILNFT